MQDNFHCILFQTAERIILHLDIWVKLSYDINS